MRADIPINPAGRVRAPRGFGSWEWDLASGRVACSRQLGHIFGIDTDSLISLELVLERVHPVDRGRVAADLAQARTAGLPFSHEFRVRRPDGSVRVVDSRGDVLLDAGQQPSRLLVSVDDITDRRQAEAERQNLVNVLDSSDDAITTCSLDGVFVSWNRGAERLYGYSAQEAIGQPLDLIVPPSERGGERGRWLRLLSNESAKSLETLRMTKDGRTVVVAVTRSLIHDATGAVVGVASVGRDITEHKRAQEMLASAHAKAVAASNMKSQFMANMNHELRTPLNGVIGISRLLLDTDLDPEQREYAEALRTSGETLLAVIGDILDFSKVEAGKLELVDEPVELRRLVEDVCSIVALGATSSRVRVLSFVEPGVPASVWGDETRLRQVLTNLTGNAVKFTAEGEVAVTVGPGETGALRFEVLDTGIGIAPEAQEAIFESFAQADGSTTRRFGGTGLGLAIARQLVTLMGGTIGVISALGKGSTFWFEVPLRAAPAPPAPPAQLRDARVLVVDASAAGRRIIAAELVGAGARAATAADGPAALARLREAARAGAPHDVVVVELGEDGEGRALVEAVRAARELDGARIVLLACSRDIGLAAQVSGVCGLVPAPVRQARLLDEVARALGAPRRSGTIAAGPPPRQSSRAGRAPRILVAEDNPINQLVARRLLEQRGFAVDIAANGREAVSRHCAEPYDAIFMDCQMPELDGYDATREIRALEGAERHTPVIALTASTMPGDTERCFAAGMDHFAAKPISPAELDAVLLSVLGVARLG